MLRFTRFFRTGLFVTLSLVLAACGKGGGGDGGGDNPGSVTPELPTREVTASITSEAMSMPAVTSIVSVTSPFGEAPIGSKLPVTNFGNGARNLLIAADDQDRPILMGFAESDTLLGVDSTVAALAEIGLAVADNPADLELEGVRPFMVSSPSYPALRAAVVTALNQGIPPQESGDVVNALSQVVLEAQRAFALSLTPASFFSGVVVNTAQTVNIKQLDYYVFNEAADEKFWLAEGPPDGLTVKNRTFLTWHLQTRATASGSPIQSVYAPPMKVTPAQLIAYYADSESSTNITPGKRFFLNISQDSVSRGQNVTRAVTKTVFSIIEIGSLALKAPQTKVQECGKKIANTLLNSNEFAALIIDPNPDAVTNYLKSIAFDMFKLVSECTNDDPADPTGETYIDRLTNEKWFKRLGRLYEALNTARTTASTFGTFNQLIKYYRFERDFEVCEYSGAVAPCIRQLTVTPDPLLASVGGTVNIPVAAFDDSGDRITRLPALIYESDNQDIAVITGVVDGVGSSVRGVAAGEARIRVTDPITGTTVQVPISVIPATDNWVVQYQVTTCTPIPSSAYAGIFYFNSPCEAIPPSMWGNGNGYIYFQAGAGTYVLESGHGMEFYNRTSYRTSNVGAIDTILTNSFSFSVLKGQAYSLTLSNSPYLHSPVEVETISANRQVDYTFTSIGFDGKSATGTFVGSLESGFYDDNLAPYPYAIGQYSDYWAVMRTQLSGTWSASKSSSAPPNVIMNGYFICRHDSAGLSLSDYLSDFGFWVEGGCQFQ